MRPFRKANAHPGRKRRYAAKTMAIAATLVLRTINVPGVSIAEKLTGLHFL
jgi:hypothetical protein